MGLPLDHLAGSTSDAGPKLAGAEVAGGAQVRGSSDTLAACVGGPLTRRNHEEATLLASPKTDRLARLAASRCHGRKLLGRPLMAMTAKKSLGPVRHVLSQMVVAGTMVVQPPVAVRVPEGVGTAGQGAREAPSGGEGEVNASPFVD